MYTVVLAVVGDDVIEILQTWWGYSTDTRKVMFLLVLLAVATFVEEDISSCAFTSVGLCASNLDATNAYSAY
ncbi:predicted protein [Pyrenophora tritici-repentis Pt-1C-BFP]|uniref:Uncharacterized protein n=1 Tax=Pyrenophora tritici-repentis (strain Pt-1C-BFP) TaxID=426418 RepID=B2W053_PYRTR|nr:uncharacterized protein PTRG_03043 [Pyrenophora tritici-repentis Pt-1C-BFP]EDU45566.1 predicted protein [Pyrenophora tritici-repentis Pt-1C-BFP]